MPYPPPPGAPVGGWAWPPPSWKGSQLGLPPSGPGSLANPWRRLGARLLDGLVLLPVYAVITGVAIALVAPHVGPIFPRSNPNDPNGSTPFPGFFWIELTFFAASMAGGAVAVAYETIATARYGRSLGKAWLHIRPIRTDRTPLDWGRSFGRTALYYGASMLSWIGLLDYLWCLWDGNSQCVHDKAVGTVVINDT